MCNGVVILEKQADRTYIMCDERDVSVEKQLLLTLESQLGKHES